jgi:hypothetical protein
VNWRESEANALDDQVAEYAMWFAQSAVVYAIAEHRGNAQRCHEIRALASALRGDAADMAAQARQLRTPVRDDERPLLKSAMTSHYARNVRPLRAGGE